MFPAERSRRLPSAEMAYTRRRRPRRSLNTATSVGVASRSRPYSTSTLFGRLAPLRICRNLPSTPNTASPPTGAATLTVPSTRLFDGSVLLTHMAGSSGSFGRVSVARSALMCGGGGPPDAQLPSSERHDSFVVNHCFRDVPVTLRQDGGG